MSTNYIPRLYDYLRRLEQNNNREWFHQNKAEYDELRALWMADLDRLIGLMSQWEPAMASQTARSAAYRFNRDTRFSRDKTPYKLYFSALLSPWGRKLHDRASYYVEIGISRSNDGSNSAGDSGLYGGVWMPDSAVLKKLRHAIVDNIEELEEILANEEMQRYFPDWYAGHTLKTIPKGWPKDHPQAELLRMCQYGKGMVCDEEFFASGDWVEKASERLRVLKPLIDFLNYSIDEDTSW